MNLGKETETLEFKKTTGEMKEAMISISSILNKHGIGTLYFGVKPNGDICGQDVSESSLRDVSRSVYESIRPQIYPAIEEVVLDGKHLIKVEFNGNNTPYSAAGRYYLRTSDEDREVTPEELKNFFVSNEYREKWEKSPSTTSAKQVDKNTVKSFWQKAVSVGRIPEGRYTCPVILKRYGLVNGDNLNNAGEYLFGSTHPVTLKAAIFATDEKLTFLDMKLFEDNIYNLLGMITIYSPGEYASNHKPEDYMKGNYESVIRNTTIAKILYLNKSIEQFGSGFKRINSLCKDAGIRFSYESDELGFKFTLYRPQRQSDIPSVTLDVALNGTEMAVLAILKQKPDSSRGEIADKISKTVRTVQRALDSLRDKGYIQRVGSKQEPRWEVLK